MPTTSKTLAKDFAEIVYGILRRRCSEPSSLKIEDINKFLDEFSKTACTQKQKTLFFERLLQPVLIQMSALEQKWLIRIILRHEKLIGLSEKTVLSLYHPDAKELYDVCNDLEKVCSSLIDQSARTSHLSAISLFKPLRPMLADREKISKFVKKMDYKPFYVETKLDGERVQIHKKGNRCTSSFPLGINQTIIFYPVQLTLGTVFIRVEDLTSLLTMDWIQHQEILLLV